MIARSLALGLTGWVSVMLIGALCQGCVGGREGRQRVNMEDNATYTIDDRRVTANAFALFEKSLAEKKGTWSCAETMEGGIVRYEAVDANGVLYEYRAVTETGRSAFSIRRKSL